MLESIISPILRITPDQISDELSMKDIESWDSLTHMDLIAELESHFTIELTMDEITEMVSVKAIRKILAAKGVQLG